MKKLLTYLGLIIGIVTLTGVSYAAAQGYGWGASQEDRPGHQTMLESKAEIFNLSVDELQAKLDAGENFSQIAEETGANLEDLRTQKQEVKQERLDSMVEDDRISQEEADEKLKRMEEKQSECDGDGPHFDKKGFGNGKMNRTK